MAGYDSDKDKIEVNGRLISAGAAKELVREVERALEVRETYMESDLRNRDDLHLNSRAIELLCGDAGGGDATYVVSFALDKGNTNLIPEAFIKEWVDKNQTHGEFVIDAEDVKPLFEVDGLEYGGFTVEAVTAEKLNEAGLM